MGVLYLQLTVADGYATLMKKHRSCQAELICAAHTHFTVFYPVTEGHAVKQAVRACVCDTRVCLQVAKIP